MKNLYGFQRFSSLGSGIGVSTHGIQTRFAIPYRRIAATIRRNAKILAPKFISIKKNLFKSLFANRKNLD
ncbi:MAG TPA: hypothetical protein DEO70_14255 [Bacteroidales bacterium]|nr:MAG: hypothetical protein A2X11_13420 [Bacteroidetes bacterium GWE2_42_24]OFY26731.1 MAG: hypothetical protein A2X09_10010 [Bacteroidetes bacterium GWF2_43_11]HBZ67993.1 hypothetical protein [Bacteroidales bacterium]